MTSTKVVYLGLCLCGFLALPSAGVACWYFFQGEKVFLFAWFLYEMALIRAIGRFRMKVVEEELDEWEIRKAGKAF